MFAWIEKRMFYNSCVESNVILGDFTAGLDAAIVKVVNLQEMPWREAESALEILQAMDVSYTNLTPMLCTWHSAEAIKKKLIKARNYLFKICKELVSPIWAWI